MSRIQLRKDQQRIVTSSTPSLPYVFGEAVVRPNFLWTPGDMWLGGQLSRIGWMRLQKGIDARGLSLSSGVIPLDLQKKTDIENVSITPNPAEVVVYSKQGTETNLQVSHPDYKGVSDLRTIFITLETGTRPLVEQTITTQEDGTYRVAYGERLPVWGRFTFNSPLPSRWIARLGTRSRAEAWTAALEITTGQTPEEYEQKINIRRTGDDVFGDLVEKYGLDLDPLSSLNKEALGMGDGVPGVSAWTVISTIADRITPPHITNYRRIEYNYGLKISGAISSAPLTFPGYFDRRNAFRDDDRIPYTQISPWSPGETLSRTGTPPFIGTQEAIIPSDIIVKWYDSSDEIVDSKVVEVLKIETKQTHEITTNMTNAVRATIFVGNSNSNHNAWLLETQAPLPRTFNDVSYDTFTITIREPEEDEDEIDFNIFGQSKAIKVPTIASLSGTRPNQTLTYSTGTWDGTFQSLRCRCPAWTLYHILTSEDFGIELKPSDIDAHSFLEASKYCINRWEFDGILGGTQDKVVEILLRLMRGWLINTDGKFSLILEKPDVAKWLICPAVVEGGNLVYRDSLPKQRVRCNYTNRLTGLRATTPGTETERLIDVDWQDPDVAERWAKWESFSEQNLLDTVEFTLPWPYHPVSVGDLVNLYDPIRAGIRTAGRIINNTATRLTLDGPPFELWPDLVAGATPLQQDRNAAIDQETWGWSTFTFPTADRPTIRVQRSGGGFRQYTVTRIDWLAGGRPEQNRVHLAEDLGSADLSRQVWAVESSAVYPTQWRVQSVSESGKEFRVVCTPYLQGMHLHIEDGTDLPVEPTRFVPATGTKLSQFSGFWDDLTMRYPDDDAGPFDPENTMDGLTTSAL